MDAPSDASMMNLLAVGCETLLLNVIVDPLSAEITAVRLDEVCPEMVPPIVTPLNEMFAPSVA